MPGVLNRVQNRPALQQAFRLIDNLLAGPIYQCIFGERYLHFLPAQSASVAAARIHPLYTCAEHENSSENGTDLRADDPGY